MGDHPKYLAKTAIEHNGRRYEPGEEIPATLSPAQLHALMAGDAIGVWQEPEPEVEGKDEPNPLPEGDDLNEVADDHRERESGADAGEAVDAASLAEVPAVTGARKREKKK